ncbi:MAG: nuclear transport factor 2 family protein [Novosphingobium meiothermophilum]|uniref:nuclear transport factor 2 family protein n=1 Tax=Novosphingobium TaxID=165696 RepID=UPI001F3204BC|nr:MULTISPECIES: nuclear transport factor 2 family protein [Novosphingobium]
MSDHPLGPRVISPGEAATRAALRHLADAYGHGVDRRDWALLRTLYHDDAVDDHTPYYCGPASGYVDWLPQMMANWRATMHTAFSQLLVLDGDRAEGEVMARAWHLTLDGTRQFIAWGRYADHYERRGGVWRFARRSFILDHAEDLPASTGDDFGSNGVGRGDAGAGDPVYARLGLFAPGRFAALQSKAL